MNKLIRLIGILSGTLLLSGCATVGYVEVIEPPVVYHRSVYVAPPPVIYYGHPHYHYYGVPFYMGPFRGR